MADMEAPEGFRAISTTQALMELAKPLMEKVDKGSDVLNSVFSLVGLIWNHDIVENSDQQKVKESKSKIVDQIEKILGLETEEAEALFQEMIERKQYLFPDEVQPESAQVMFLRKTSTYAVEPFDYDGLLFSPDPIPPDEQDLAAIEKIRQVDLKVIGEFHRRQYEAEFYSMVGEVQGRYAKWLDEKGLGEWSRGFSSNMDIFLNYVYLFPHPEAVVLKSIPVKYLDEFFFDFLVSKLSAGPDIYVTFPPTLKFFYRFLLEKGYLSDL
ncbi:MAG: hypothetical protein ACLGPL_03915, partial [Acidobacteriota bacterium]